MVIYNVYKTFADISKTKDGNIKVLENQLRNVFAGKYFWAFITILKGGESLLWKDNKEKEY